MTSATLIAFRDEVSRAIDQLGPEVRGFRAIAKLPLSNEALEYINDNIDVLMLRETLLVSAASAVDALTADGYPDVKGMVVPVDVYKELQGRIADIVIALGEIEAANASNLSVVLGNATEKGV